MRAAQVVRRKPPRQSKQSVRRGLDLRDAARCNPHGWAARHTECASDSPGALQRRNEVTNHDVFDRFEAPTGQQHRGAPTDTYQVVGRALELLLVLFQLAARDLDRALRESPDALLAGPPIPIADDLRDALHEAQGLLVRASQDQRPVMLGEREPDLQVRLAAPSLPTVEQLVRFGQECLGLRPGVGHPEPVLGRRHGLLVEGFLLFQRKAAQGLENLVQVHGRQSSLR